MRNVDILVPVDDPRAAVPHAQNGTSCSRRQHRRRATDSQPRHKPHL